VSCTIVTTHHANSTAVHPPPHTELADLRLRFEEDKKKIAKLRAQRKFKPF
jgi:hypothetical protein